ncbi:MAG: protease SohB [Cardiobacteriaceae bacterium]|nr:protease SohB [Cardiobacteriaceae bacterium]
MGFFASYGLFLAEILTLVFAIMAVIAVAAKSKTNKNEKAELKVELLNDRYEEMNDTIFAAIADKKEWKNYCREQKQASKNRGKDKDGKSLPRLFVLDFDGDIAATDADELREQISAILQTAKEGEQVLLRLESAGGYVHSYGFAASQLARLREKSLHLTVAVDKIAASGGYMMACVGSEIIAAPFAVIGSVGVVGALPNFHDLLEKQSIHYEEHTAGEFKRTLTMFGENTDGDRQQFRKELQETHELFQQHIREYRPNLDVAKIATGETWYGKKALEKGLIDKIQTSDDFLLAMMKTHNILELSHSKTQSLIQKLKEEFLSSVSVEGIKKSAQGMIKPFKADIQ